MYYILVPYQDPRAMSYMFWKCFPNVKIRQFKVSQWS